MKPSISTLQQRVFHYLKNGQLSEARTLLEEVCLPGNSDKQAWLMLASVTGKLEDYPAAERCCRAALELDAKFAEAHFHLGNALREQARLPEAIRSYQNAISCNPDFANAYYWLGNVLRKTWQHDKAVQAFRQALNINPANVNVLYDLGNTYKAQGRVLEAIDCFRQVLEIKPDFAMAQMTIAACMNRSDSFDRTTVLEQHRRWGEMQEKCSVRRTGYKNTPDPDRLLRIGYVSPDFRKHSVAYFFEPILANHDTDKYEITCYAELDQQDEVSKRLQAIAHAWRETKGLKSDELAALIQSDKIDILVDLAGLTTGNRLDSFVNKPAPVQMTYLGYAATTGLSCMDYRITDELSDPPGKCEQDYTETLVRLPHGFLCYKPSANSPELSSLPAKKTRHITFGSFNNLIKITPDVVRVWSTILKSVKYSRLIMKALRFNDRSIQDRYFRLFQNHGIPRNRVQMMGRIASEYDHLNMYSQVDIALDTFPYNGTTTTCDALWMGVPVIAIKGSRHISRVSWSIIHQVGLDELVADNEDDYINTAIELAGDKDRLAQLRSTIRNLVADSTLCDPVSFTKNIEAAYRDAWARWCSEAHSIK